MAFRKWVTRQGVPWKAVKDVFNVTPVRAVGYGSPTARMAAFERMLKIFPQLDPTGQSNLVRDIVIQNVGQDMADRYKSRGQPRLGIGASIAELQNDAMQAGRQVAVRGDEDHFSHVIVHAPDAMQFVQALQQNQVDPMLALQYLTLQEIHTNEHLQFLQGDEMHANEIAEVKHIMGLVHETVEALSKQAASGQLPGQQPPPEQQGQQQQQGPDAEVQMKVQKHQLELQMAQERHELEMQILQKKADQELAIKDARAASDISPGRSRPLPILADAPNTTGDEEIPATAGEFAQENLETLTTG